MSEVKRISVFIHGPNKAIDMVEAVHLDRVTAERDAALGRESALQEELSTAHRGLANCKLALDAQTHNYDVTNLRLIGAEQRLTAADERASELLIMLRMAWVDTEVSADNCRRIDAALKPADGQRNQCDGCQAGIPVVNGAHRMGKPGGYPDTMSCTAKLYADDRPAGCCCPPRGHVGLWAGAMCPVHYGLRAIKPAEMLPADHKCIECDSEYCHGVCVERGDSDDRLIG